MILSIDTFQFISIILVLIAFFLGFKILETSWSYKINKPYKWETAVKQGKISSALIKSERKCRDKVRFYNLWFQIERLKKENIAGAFAELGVYKGETALLIHQMDASRNLHLFDTFDGFTERDLKSEIINDDKYSTTNFSDTDLQSVKNLFDESNNIFFYKGYFPETTKELKEETFALVHLDADLYEPTIAALHYFYPKLAPGGVIIVHDYNHTWAGIERSVDEFKKTIPESVIEIADWQGSVMIVKNKVVGDNTNNGK